MTFLFPRKISPCPSFPKRGYSGFHSPFSKGGSRGILASRPKWFRVARLIALLPFTSIVSYASAADVSVAKYVETVNGHSSRAHISADGRFVAFDSYATNLVAGDTSQTSRVLVHDRSTGATKVVNATGGGAPANANSVSAALTEDGRYVAFASDATNLIPEDTNLFRDIFVRELRTGKTERVSVHTNGAQAVNGHSSHPSISADGRYVAFASEATNLVEGDTNGFTDIFVHDRVAGTTQRVNVATGGAQAVGAHSFYPSISPEGRFVAFVSDAANLVPNDTNNSWDIFVHDRQTQTTSRASVAGGGAQADAGSARPSISADGRYVAFESGAANLVPDDTNGVVDVFVHDRGAKSTMRVSVVTDDNSKAP